jgi:hypothetical protein
MGAGLGREGRIVPPRRVHLIPTAELLLGSIVICPALLSGGYPLDRERGGERREARQRIQGRTAEEQAPGSPLKGRDRSDSVYPGTLAVPSRKPIKPQIRIMRRKGEIWGQKKRTQ